MRPVLREQIVDLVLSLALDDGGERCRQPCLGIDAVHFTGLCRTPNYAERAGFPQLSF